MDIAICVNDWCIEFDAKNNPRVAHQKLHALLSGYQTVRALTETEKEHWLIMLQLAALRFWVSRQLAWKPGESHQNITIKDPAPFEGLFRLYRNLQLSRKRLETPRDLAHFLNPVLGTCATRHELYVVDDQEPQIGLGLEPPRFRPHFEDRVPR